MTHHSRSRRLRAGTAAVVATSIACALSATSAVEAAQSSSSRPSVLVHHDPRHDVLAAQLTPFHSYNATHRSEGDISEVRARYGRRYIWTHVYYARLAKPTPVSSKYAGDEDVFDLDTPKGEYHLIERTTPRRSHGRMLQFISPAGASVRCPFSFTVNYQRARVGLRMPRRCVDDPAWVRVAFLTDGVRGNTSRFDNAFAGNNERADEGYGPFSTRIWRP
jgi:hypothetical protein